MDPALGAIVRRLLDVFNGEGLETLEAIVAEDFIDHAPIPGQPPGLAGMRHKAACYRAALPEARTVVEEISPTGDAGVVQVTWVTTETDGSPCPPRCRYTALLTIAGGRLRESRMLGMLQLD
jgi:ketosteroid isomerase-like protein